jgi:hypothetical protein
MTRIAKRVNLTAFLAAAWRKAAWLYVLGAGLGLNVAKITILLAAIFGVA